MKDIYTLFVYKSSGRYGGCTHGCCPSSHYDGDAEIIIDEDIDAVLDRCFEIHSKNRLVDINGRGTDMMPEGNYEFHIFLNGAYVDSFCVSPKDSCDIWVRDMSTLDDNSNEYWELEEKKNIVRKKIKDRVASLNKP